jgi:hypothetical protein
VDVISAVECAQPGFGSACGRAGSCDSGSNPTNKQLEGGGLPLASAAPGGAPGEALGTTVKSASALAGQGTIRRYQLQAAAKGLLRSEKRLQGCSSWVISAQAGVQLLHVPKRRSGAYRGLRHCGSVWWCPVCASKITERRRQELEQATTAAASRSWTVLLVTYTIRHKRADSLEASLTGLLKARRGLLSGRWAQGFDRRHRIAGRIRALEVTHGANGWHPHVHELVFIEGDQVDRGAFLDELRQAWSARLQKAGLRDVNQHGLDVRFADLSVSEYLAKFGHERTWGPSHELTKAAVKGSKNGNRGPIGLLAAYAEGDQQAGAIWAEYAAHFKGKRQLHWSHGLREKLGLNEEKTDEELAEETREEAVLMDVLKCAEWKRVLGNDARAELLLVLGTGDQGKLRTYLVSMGIERTLPAGDYDLKELLALVIAQHDEWQLEVQIERMPSEYKRFFANASKG